MFQSSIIGCCSALIFLLALLNGANADEAGWQIYLGSLKSQQQLLVAENAIEQDRFAAMDQLHQRGHASWLEKRKQELKLNESNALLHAFQDYLANVEKLQAKFSVSDSQRLRFGSLMFTDLQLASNSPIQSGDMQAQLNELRAKHADSQQESNRLAGACQNLIPDEPWKKLALLRYQRELKTTNWLAAQIRFLEHQILASEETNGQDEVEFAVSDQLNVDLREAIGKQCDLHQKIAQYVLDFENERLVAMQEMDANGYGKPADTNAVWQHVEQLKSLQEKHSQVVDLLNSTTEESAYVRRVPNLRIVSGKSVAREIHQQLTCCESQYQIQVAKLRKQMLNDVLNRLLEVQQNEYGQNHSNGMYRSVSIAKDREIASYRWRIELTELELQLAQARLKTASAAGEQFVMIDGLDHQKVSKSLFPMGRTLGLAFASLNHALVADGVDLEVSDRIDLSPFAVGLNRFPGVHFNSHNSLYRPISLSSSYRIPRSRYRGSSSLANSSLKSTTRPSASASSSFTSRRSYSRSRFDHHHRYRGRFPTRAYPFGNLDSSLRSFITPGQPPWLLPSSPTNLRTQQLRTNIGRDSFGRTGNQLLKNRIYTDIYRR